MNISQYPLCLYDSQSGLSELRLLKCWTTVWDWIIEFMTAEMYATTVESVSLGPGCPVCGQGDNSFPMTSGDSDAAVRELASGNGAEPILRKYDLWESQTVLLIVNTGIEE